MGRIAVDFQARRKVRCCTSWWGHQRTNDLVAEEVFVLEFSENLASVFVFHPLGLQDVIQIDVSNIHIRRITIGVAKIGFC